MNRIFYAEKDTTLYEKHENRNTGIDEILQLVKITCGSRFEGNIQNNTYNSRILLDFGTEVTTIASEITAGNIPAIDKHLLYLSHGIMVEGTLLIRQKKK